MAKNPKNQPGCPGRIGIVFGRRLISYLASEAHLKGGWFGLNRARREPLRRTNGELSHELR